MNALSAEAVNATTRHQREEVPLVPVVPVVVPVVPEGWLLSSSEARAKAAEMRARKGTKGPQAPGGGHSSG